MCWLACSNLLTAPSFPQLFRIVHARDCEWRNVSIHTLNNHGPIMVAGYHADERQSFTIKSQKCVTLHNSSPFGFSTLLHKTKGVFITDGGLRRHIKLLHHCASSFTSDQEFHTMQSSHLHMRLFSYFINVRWLETWTYPLTINEPQLFWS